MKPILATVAGVASGLLLGSTLFAQTGTARGKVVDENGRPLAEVKVLLEFQGGITRKHETQSNKKGEYIQVGLSPGVYKLTFTKDGYQPFVVDTRIGLGDATFLPDVKLPSRAAASAAAKGADKKGEEISGAFKKAVDLAQAGKLDEAEEAYKAVLAKNDQIPEAHYNLGILYVQKKNWPAAEEAYKKAIEIRPGYPEAYRELSRVYFNNGQIPKAFELLTKATTDKPENAGLWFELGILNLNSGKSEEAIAAFKKAEGLDPSNPEIQYQLGTLAIGQNNATEAVSRLEKYLSMSPKNAQNVKTAQDLIQALKPKK